MAKKKSSIKKMMPVVLLVLGSIAIVVIALLFNRVKLTTDELEAASPGWITSCNYSHSKPDDPIVSFGQPGAAHMHDFIGSRITDTFTTVEALHADGTTCVMPNDKSAYWAPAVFVNNSLVLPMGTRKHALFYYRRGSMKAGTVFQTIPDGLKMIVGNQHAKSEVENEGIKSGRIFFKCGPGSGTNLSHPPSQCSSGVMVISFTFPNCWDGVNLDSVNHISHMSYPNSGQCPTTHPIAIPRLQAYIRYGVGTGSLSNVMLSSGPYFTAHMDFFNGWDTVALQQLVDKCINGGQDCGTNPAVSL